MDLREVVRRLSEEAERNTNHQHIREAIRRTGGVPVYTDMGGALLITQDGDVWQYDFETGAMGVENDEKLRTLALINAARRFSEFQSLAPQRPAGAIDCSSCGGSGFVKPRLYCGVCSGTGWMKP